MVDTLSFKVGDKVRWPVINGEGYFQKAEGLIEGFRELPTGQTLALLENGFIVNVKILEGVA